MLKRLLSSSPSPRCSAPATPPRPGSTVTLTATRPAAGAATVAWGDTVTFANADDKAHRIMIPRVNLESPTIPPGGTFEYVFDGRRGNYGYRQAGGGPNKLGTVVVELKGSVTLKASATTVPWASAALSRRVHLPRDAGQHRRARAGSGAAWARPARPRPAADGAYALDLEPQRGAQYRAQVAADQISSAAVRISVRPLAHGPRAREEREGRPARSRSTARVTPPQAATSSTCSASTPATAAG